MLKKLIHKTKILCYTYTYHYIFSSNFKWALLQTHLLSFNMTALNSNWPNLDMYIVVKTPKGQP